MILFNNNVNAASTPSSPGIANIPASNYPADPSPIQGPNIAGEAADGH